MELIASGMSPIWVPPHVRAAERVIRAHRLPDLRQWLSGLVNGGMVNRGHALVNGGMIRAKAATGGGSPPVTGYVLWLKSDIGTFQTVGGSAASADNDPVGQWQDQSGNSRHVSQATAGRRPLLKTGQIAGYPSIRFDGTDDYLNALWTFSKPMTVFLVVNQITWTNADHIMGGGSGDDNNIYQSGSSPSIAYYAGVTGNGNPSVTPAGTGVWSIVCAMGAAASGSKQLRVNAGTASTRSGTASGVNGINLGSHPNPSNYANCEFAEVVMYASVLNSTDETSVRDYLNTKYAIF